ncbi:hypothetical protein Corgl_1034 [Coriobacterium glomerans PW2]|uniref:Uncharacterized protein n=1 Tax=Coriobacterium glomerans (strain ATCC 49209 / DSM 20642 / JCM 10262 / PW2) TaxID=700015 RepID=F2N9N9_CORGP|nr:hypothetical protein Corgl_1034 [Coriobacterium glomerans PW2]
MRRWLQPLSHGTKDSDKKIAHRRPMTALVILLIMITCAATLLSSGFADTPVIGGGVQLFPEVD